MAPLKPCNIWPANHPFYSPPTRSVCHLYDVKPPLSSALGSQPRSGLPIITALRGSWWHKARVMWYCHRSAQTGTVQTDPRQAHCGWLQGRSRTGHTHTHYHWYHDCFVQPCTQMMWRKWATGAVISASLRRSSRGTDVNSIITLLLEVDVVLLPEPGVGQVARVRLRLAGEECILGNVDGDVFRRRDDVGRPWEKQTVVIETRQDLHRLRLKLMIKLINRRLREHREVWGFAFITDLFGPRETEPCLKTNCSVSV